MDIGQGNKRAADLAAARAGTKQGNKRVEDSRQKIRMSIEQINKKDPVAGMSTREDDKGDQAAKIGIDQVDERDSTDLVARSFSYRSFF